MKLWFLTTLRTKKKLFKKYTSRIIFKNKEFFLPFVVPFFPPLGFLGGEAYTLGMSFEIRDQKNVLKFFQSKI